MNRKFSLLSLWACFLLIICTACNTSKTMSTDTQATICQDFKLDNQVTLGVYVPSSNDKAYICTTPETSSFNGNLSALPFEIYSLAKTKEGYSQPELFLLPDEFTYSIGMAVSPDGEKMYLSAQNADFFGNDSINILVGDIEGNTLTHLTALDEINTTYNQFVTGIDKDQNLIYITSTDERYAQIFYSPYEDGTYKPGVLMSEAINGEGYQSLGAALSPDGNHIINTHQRYQDLYYSGILMTSSLKDEKWEPAAAFDLNINDPNTLQLFPSISGDGRTLYYLSIPFEANHFALDLSRSEIYQIDLKTALNSLLPATQIASNTAYDTSDFPLEKRQKSGISEKQGVYYEIFVRAFADSDGDGIGDFNGLTSKLDYLKDLGVDGLWLMPINTSPSYHGYDVIDYASLNSEYGTEEDFKHLLEEAHKRDIKIIMDFVINHTSNQHPWFTSATFSNSSPYRDYYRIVDPNDTENYIEGATSPWNSSVWHPFSNLYYYGIFSDSMPDLNYNNEKVREEIKNAAIKWLEMGVDGFRLDAALHIYGAHEFEKQESSLQSNLQWWNEFALACEAINPNVYLVGEAWDSDNPLEDYVQPFDTKFNFTLQSNVLYAIKNGISITSHGDDLATSLQTLRDTYNTVDTNYIDGIFAANHDQDRIMSSVAGIKPMARLFPHIYMTLPGNPYLYYGEELGMRGSKPDELIRLDFKWTDDLTKTPNCNWGNSIWGKDFTSINQDVPSLETQEKDPDSMYQLYKRLIALRKAHAALSTGDYAPIATENIKVLGYERFTDEESLIVLHNLSAKETTVTLEQLQDATCLYTSNETQTLSQDTLTLPAYSTVIYQRS
ncbi:MAG: DUF3459 domain-containing protein [Cellulosilyticum sp.]|nr:DUF3459 domain-containing protein [Cellulosilyticum sp.]